MGYASGSGTYDGANISLFTTDDLTPVQTGGTQGGESYTWTLSWTANGFTGTTWYVGADWADGWPSMDDTTRRIFGGSIAKALVAQGNYSCASYEVSTSQ